MKVHNYRYAARFQSSNRGRANLLVLAANQLVRVKSAVEDTGTSAGNSRQKVDEAAVLVRLYNGDMGFRRYMHEYCANAGFDFSEEKIILAGDDTCLYLPEAVWVAFSEIDEVRRVAGNLIAEASNELIDYEINGELHRFRGPGINTTYFISAMGIATYRDALYKAGEIACASRDYPILRRSTLTTRRLSDPAHIVKYVGTSVVQLISSAHRNRGVFPNELHFDNAFLAEYGHPDRPISEFLYTYLGERDSYAHAYIQLLDAMFPYKSETPPLPQTSEGHHAATPNDPWLTIQQMGDGEKQAPLTFRSFNEQQFRRAPKIDTSSPMALLNLDPYIANGDAFVLGPPGSTRDADLRWWAYVMYALIIAVKTHPRDAEKVVIIIVDAAALRFAELYFALANNGWTEDYIVGDDGENVPVPANAAIRHIRTGICHFLIGSDSTRPFPLAAAEAMANAILQQHEETAFRLPQPYNEYMTTPIALDLAENLKPSDVSFMCTAHSERREVHEDCALIGTFLTRSGRSATWPGNDRNNMRSLYNSLKDCPRLIGVITEHLADAATWNGRIPECTHPIMASHIYERMLLLIILGRCHVVFPIGVGGILEVSSRFLVDDFFPDFSGRTAIFYSPNYAHLGPSRAVFMESILLAFIGEVAYEAMVNGLFPVIDGRARSYLYAPTLERVRELINAYV